MDTDRYVQENQDADSQEGKEHEMQTPAVPPASIPDALNGSAYAAQRRAETSSSQPEPSSERSIHAQGKLWLSFEKSGFVDQRRGLSHS